MYKLHTNCRVCGSSNLTPYLDLGMMPLSNNLCAEQSEEVDRYPLQVLLCENCSLSQLSIVIDPSTLFSHYVYRSDISKGYRDHCHKMAIDLKERYGLNENSFHIDIAGNDGALLYEFKKVVGGKSLNVDPAMNLEPINAAKGIRMFNMFWGKLAAEHLINTHWLKADLITATNVFAHVSDVKEFLLSCKSVLARNGVIILEFPYLLDFIEKKEFDTVYFEHLSYFSITPLALLAEACGMWIMSVDHFDIHGGSVRVHIGYGNHDSSVDYYIHREKLSGTFNLDTYNQWATDVQSIIKAFRSGIKKLKYAGKTIAAFGASAKGNTLLNCAGITNEIDYIIDETPEKIGKFSPGTGIQIVSLDVLETCVPDYIVLLAWNFSKECIDKCEAAGFKGKYIFPLTFDIV